MYARFRYSGKNPMWFAVFWRISVRFCGFAVFKPPLRPPPKDSEEKPNPAEYSAKITKQVIYTFTCSCQLFLMIYSQQISFNRCRNSHNLLLYLSVSLLNRNATSCILKIVVTFFLITYSSSQPFAENQFFSSQPWDIC